MTYTSTFTKQSKLDGSWGWLTLLPNNSSQLQDSNDSGEEELAHSANNTKVIIYEESSQIFNSQTPSIFNVQKIDNEKMDDEIVVPTENKQSSPTERAEDGNSKQYKMKLKVISVAIKKNITTEIPSSGNTESLDWLDNIVTENESKKDESYEEMGTLKVPAVDQEEKIEEEEEDPSNTVEDIAETEVEETKMEAEIVTAEREGRETKGKEDTKVDFMKEGRETEIKSIADIETDKVVNELINGIIGDLPSDNTPEDVLSPDNITPTRRFLRRRLPKNRLALYLQRKRTVTFSNTQEKENTKTAKQEESKRSVPSQTKRGSKLKTDLSNTQSIAKCPHCRLFVGAKELPYDRQYPFPIPETNKTDVTLVSTTTSNRLSFIPYLLERWSGDFSIVVKIAKNEESRVVETIKSLNNPSRVRIILYIVLPKEKYFNAFPVNRLRNIGIVNIVTSHYIVLDMDMWPNHNLYSEIQKIPPSILESPTSATIVPAFFLDKPAILNNCRGLLSCAKESERRFPRDRKELLKCLKSKKCLLYKKNTVTHRYINKQWFTIPPNQPIVRVSCFMNRFQEPYILLRYSSDTIFYNEQFINYGCNKVQLIDHIRHMGYRFYVLTNTFAIDIVHHDSSYRKEYIERIHRGKDPHMRVLCYDYQKQLDSMYPPAKNQTKTCKDEHAVFYKSF